MSRAFALLCLSSIVVLGPEALAQASDYRDGKSSLYLGIFFTDRDTETRFDSGRGPGTDIKMEDDLGLESSMNVLRVGGHVWFKPRQRFDFSLFDLSRKASRPISETIEFGDRTFEIDTTVDSTFDFSIAKADYTFSVLSRSRGYLGLTGGLYIASFKVGLSQETLGNAESEQLTAPLPVIGLRGAYQITERFAITGAAQWFRLEVGDAGGRLNDYYVGADYDLTPRFDIGLAYNEVGMRIKATESHGLTGQLIWDYAGWLVYFRTSFGN